MTRVPDAEVAVVGLGAIGSMTLWRLAQHGATVHGYEQFGVGHDRGAASGQNRRFSVQSQGDPVFTPLALRARELWSELESQTGTRLLHNNGGLIIGPAEHPRVVNAQHSAQLHDLPHEVLSRSEVLDRYPQHALDDGDIAITDPYAGFLRPERSVLTAVRRARELGAVVRERAGVTALERTDDGVVVRTRDGEATYRRVVVSTGAWARRLLPQLEPYVLPRRLVQTWFAPHDPDEFTPDRFPVFERVGRITGYGFPSVDGATVKIAVRLGEHPVVQDLDAVHRTISPEVIDAYAALVAAALPTLNPYPVSTALGMEGYSSDGRAFVGPSAPGSDVVAAVGFSGSGFKFAPAMGDAAARYALGEPTIPEVAMLWPDRQVEPWEPALRSRS